MLQVTLALRIPPAQWLEVPRIHRPLSSPPIFDGVPMLLTRLLLEMYKHELVTEMDPTKE